AAFFADAAEKRALEAAAADAGRAGRGVPGEAPAERRRGAVLVVEMPRYARSGPDDEPRELAERLGRDLTEVRRAVTRRGGRVEAALGHRALAFFDGEGPAARALGAAAEVLRALSKPENAFDEPVPPALALATGPAVLGGPEGARTVAGLPVQQAEGLLREASSGDLILSRAAYGEVEQVLAAAGVAIAPQRGLLTPQPVYLLDAGRAARAAEALGAADGERGAELAALAPGMVVADRFALEERLSAGGLGVAFRARDRQSGAPAVVRALRRDLVADPGALEALDGEIRGLLRVAHPAVARVLELGVSGGVPFVASEPAEGPTLARVLAGRGSLPAPAALRLARGVAAGLGAIHAAGRAHGALRPEAVVLDPRGHARLIDLGVAELLPPPGVDPEADAALGPPRYLGPERLAGGPPTPRSDVYAAGVLLAEAFTGRPVGEDGAAEAPDATELPDGLAPVLARCLARNPEERYADGGELAKALGPVRADLVASG
ncbi:MAG TPA: protein kinase, partial [Thermoanaerobaculia bacterium]|nr:protein kinase [Thermoanaerobaculia bacterium]